MKKRWLLLLFLFPLSLSAQHYVDILKINYGENFHNRFEGFQEHTRAQSWEMEFTLPFKLSESQALITGINHSNDRLQLFPQDKLTRLYNTTLKLGLASVWNEKWSSSIVLLPKLASDYKSLSNKDFYMGIYATFAIKKQENFKYRFGLYASTEAYGVFATPILGGYYLSPNHRFEMNMSLPISGEMTYDLGKISVGTDYYGISRSFRVHRKETPSVYVDLTSLRFSSFVQKEIFEKQILLRAKLGYSTQEYQLYKSKEKIDLALSAINFGDHRSQLNPKIKGGLFFKIEGIYRFHF